LEVFLKPFGGLEDALGCGVQQLGNTVVIHLKILGSGVGAVAATDTFGDFLSDSEHGGCQGSSICSIL
jgi:hypothetical protein